MLEAIWTVLVVDDDPTIREQMSDLLTLEGFAVLDAVNGARALDVLRAVPGRCLVLLDLDMPLMTGQQFLLELSTLPRSSRFPVVVISGEPDAGDVARMPGVMEVLKKPLAGDRMIEVVKEHASAVGKSLRR